MQKDIEVRYVDHMGSDMRVCNMARQSFGKWKDESELNSTDDPCSTTCLQVYPVTNVMTMKLSIKLPLTGLHLRIVSSLFNVQYRSS